MAKKRKRIADDDDDDADDYVPVGRPREPEQFGPPKPEPHEREEYARRLQSLIDAVEIRDIAKDARSYLQFLLRRCDRLRGFDAKRFPSIGEEVVTLLLRTVFESTNGAAALTAPILKAVNICMKPAWVDRGLEWIESFDRIDLVGLLGQLRELGLERHLGEVLCRKLTGILGSHMVAQPVPKPARIRKKQEKPPGLSEALWNATLELQRKRRREQYHRRRQRQLAAGVKQPAKKKRKARLAA